MIYYATFNKGSLISKGTRLTFQKNTDKQYGGGTDCTFCHKPIYKCDYTNNYKYDLLYESYLVSYKKRSRTSYISMCIDCINIFVKDKALISDIYTCGTLYSYRTYNYRHSWSFEVNANNAICAKCLQKVSVNIYLTTIHAMKIEDDIILFHNRCPDKSEINKETNDY